MNARQIIYVLLAVAGLCMTWYHNLAFMEETAHIFSLDAFVAGVFANHASSSVGWDITVACAAFTVWMLHDARQTGMRHAWIYVVLTFAIAFAVAAPTFLFMRERHLARNAAPR